MSRLSSSGPTTVDDWIGCLAINEAVFFPPDAWVPLPRDWRREIVSGKGYDLGEGEGRQSLDACLDATAALDHAADWTTDAMEQNRRGAPQLVRPRLGQASFRLAVSEAYGQRCAVTGERSLPVVEASHIRPFTVGGAHEVSNGLPLRRDVHRLFDLGFVTVRPDLRFAVSSSLRDDWRNGKEYYALQDRRIRLPHSDDLWPSSAQLEWHGAEVFRG